MSNRNPIKKSVRKEVYDKYNGHCAYCGCELDFKEMQIDHVTPVYWLNGENNIENYMPSCRMCNFYKSTYTIEKFRERIQTIQERLEKIFIFRLAIKYGIIKSDSNPIAFYFEKEDK